MVIALLSPAAVAQNVTIDETLAGKTSISPADRQIINGHVSANTDGLFSDDPTTLRRARNLIVEPLQYDSVSVAFRIAYGDALESTLDRAVSSKDPRVSLNALRIAGILSTQASTQHLLDRIDDEDEDTRFMAAHAMELVFKEVTRAAPAIGQDRARQLTDALGATVAGDANPFVVDAAVRALDAAAAGRWPAVAQDAMTTMAEKLGQRVRALNPGPDDQWILLADARALERLRQRINAGNVQGLAIRDAAKLAGHTLAYVGARLDLADDVPIDDRERGQLADLAARAETIIFFATTPLGGNPTPTNLADNITEGHDDRFIEGLPGVLGAGGQLANKPFGFKPADFIREPPGNP